HYSIAGSGLNSTSSALGPEAVVSVLLLNPNIRSLATVSACSVRSRPVPFFSFGSGSRQERFLGPTCSQVPSPRSMFCLEFSSCLVPSPKLGWGSWSQPTPGLGLWILSPVPVQSRVVSVLGVQSVGGSQIRDTDLVFVQARARDPKPNLGSLCGSILVPDHELGPRFKFVSGSVKISITATGLLPSALGKVPDPIFEFRVLDLDWVKLLGANLGSLSGLPRMSPSLGLCSGSRGMCLGLDPAWLPPGNSPMELGSEVTLCIYVHSKHRFQVLSPSSSLLSTSAFVPILGHSTGSWFTLCLGLSSVRVGSVLVEF
uniref:Uncharacterized protein n=1 Tax=Cannabis sativa TaxID=3483 RepID=A0A803QRW0_CANSA